MASIHIDISGIFPNSKVITAQFRLFGQTLINPAAGIAIQLVAAIAK
jgi:hypothetical protein